MKNVNPAMLKTCIFMTAEQYEATLREIYGDSIEVTFEMDGVSVGYFDGDTPDVEPALAEYFGVTEVTSVHIDDCEPTGVWVCYKK